MKYAWCITVCALLSIVWLAGCGGGGGSADTGGLGGTTLTLQVVDDWGIYPMNADWVAIQDGSGAWTKIDPTGVGQYAATITSADGRYGLAIAYANGAERNVHVYQATLSEASTLVIPLRSDAPGLSDVTMTTNITNGTVAGNSLFIGSDVISAANGAHPIFAGNSLDLAFTFANGTKALVERDISATADFSRAYNLATDTHAFTLGASQTVTAPAMSAYDYAAYFRTLNGTPLDLPLTASFAAGSGTYVPVPVGQSVPFEQHKLSLRDTSRTDASRYYFANYRTPQPVTFTAMADFAMQAPTFTVTPYVRPIYAWTAYPSSKAYAFTSFERTGNRYYSVVLSAGWLNGATTYTFPNLSGAVGWNTNWQLATLTANIGTDAGAITSTGTLFSCISAFDDLWWWDYTRASADNVITQVAVVYDQAAMSRGVSRSPRHRR